MSGSGCINGYGYLGMAHAVDQHQAAVVIPVDRIKECIQNNRESFMRFEDCSELEILTPPKLGFRDKR